MTIALEDSGTEGTDFFERVARAVSSLSPVRRLAVAGGFGAIGALALPPVGAVPLLVVAFTGLLVLFSAAQSRWGGFGVGWAFGLGFHLVGLYWVSSALFVDIARFWWALPLSVLGLPLLMATYGGLATLAMHALRPQGVLRPLVLAVCWGAGEWVRGHAFTGFPWNLPAYAWADMPAMLQPVAVIGSYGWTAITVLLVSLPALLFDRAVPRRVAMVGVVIGVLALGAIGGWGLWRLSFDTGAVVQGVRLRLVQPAIPQELKWVPGQRDHHLETQINMGTEPAQGPAPTHIFWSEMAAPFFLEGDRMRRSLIGAATPPGGVTVTGVPRMAQQPGGERIFYNGLVAIDELGTVVAGYSKAHLVPFGEYVPFRRWLPFGTLDEAGAEYTPGAGPATLDLPGLPPVSPLICYEVIFPGAVTDASGRAQWMLNITNDAWYGGSAGPYQHFAIATARAVEEGLPLVRVANTGISGVIDAYGRVKAQLPLEAKGVLDADLPVALARSTPYRALGDGPFLFFVAAGLTLALILRRNGRF